MEAQADSVDKTTAVLTCGHRCALDCGRAHTRGVLVFVSPAIAFPLIAAGMALVAIGRQTSVEGDSTRHRASFMR